MTARGGDKKKIASNKTKQGVLGLAMDDQRTAAVVEQWDADPWLLCTPGGTVDLQTGTLRAARPSDYMTMTTAVAPGGACPLWHKFLDRVTAGDKKLIRYLQVCCGYALTGLVRGAQAGVPVGRRPQRQIHIRGNRESRAGRLRGDGADGDAGRGEAWSGAASDRASEIARRTAGGGGGERARHALERDQGQDADRR